MKKALFLLPICLSLVSCNIEKSYEPIEYCLYEVSYEYEYTQFEDFEENCYYKEIKVNSEEQWTKGVKSVYWYEIDVLNCEKNTIDVWWGGIAFKSKGKTKYKPSEYVWIDCDWAYSIPLETILMPQND